MNILLTKEKCKAFLFIFDKEYKMSFLKKFYQPGYNYDENQDIIQNIYYILNTSKNFHSFQKDLGLEISGYFTKNKESVEELKKQICKNIEKYESRVKLTNIDEGTRISDSRLQFKLKFELKQKKYKKPEQIFITFDSSVLNKIIIDKIAGTK